MTTFACEGQWGAHTPEWMMFLFQSKKFTMRRTGNDLGVGGERIIGVLGKWPSRGTRPRMPPTHLFSIPVTGPVRGSDP